MACKNGADMKILKTFVAVEGSNEISIADTIEHEGKLWLVPEWLEATEEGWRTPARIILMEDLKQQPAPKGYPADFLLNEPIPKSVFDGQTTDGYTVVDRPGMRYPIPPAVH